RGDPLRGGDDGTRPLGWAPARPRTRHCRQPPRGSRGPNAGGRAGRGRRDFRPLVAGGHRTSRRSIRLSWACFGGGRRRGRPCRRTGWGRLVTRGISHVGVTVADLERAVRFYTD